MQQEASLTPSMSISTSPSTIGLSHQGSIGLGFSSMRSSFGPPPEFIRWMSSELGVRDAHNVHVALDAVRIVQKWGKYMISTRRKFRETVKTMVKNVRRIQRWWRQVQFQRDRKLEMLLMSWYKKRGGLTVKERSSRFRDKVKALFASDEAKAKQVSAELDRDCDKSVMMEVLMQLYIESREEYVQKKKLYEVDQRRRKLAKAKGAAIPDGMQLKLENSELIVVDAPGFDKVPKPVLKLAPKFNELQCRYDIVKASDAVRRIEEYRNALESDVTRDMKALDEPAGESSEGSTFSLGFVAFADSETNATTGSGDDTPTVSPSTSPTIAAVQPGQTSSWPPPAAFAFTVTKQDSLLSIESHASMNHFDAKEDVDDATDEEERVFLRNSSMRSLQRIEQQHQHHLALGPTPAALGQQKKVPNKKKTNTQNQQGIRSPDTTRLHDNYWRSPPSSGATSGSVTPKYRPRSKSTREVEKSLLAAAYEALPSTGHREERMLWTNDLSMYYLRRSGRDAMHTEEARRISQRLSVAFDHDNTRRESHEAALVGLKEAVVASTRRASVSVLGGGGAAAEVATSNKVLKKSPIAKTLSPRVSGSVAAARRASLRQHEDRETSLSSQTTPEKDRSSVTPVVTSPHTTGLRSALHGDGPRSGGASRRRVTIALNNTQFVEDTSAIQHTPGQCDDNDPSFSSPAYPHQLASFAAIGSDAASFHGSSGGNRLPTAKVYVSEEDPQTIRKQNTTTKVTQEGDEVVTTTIATETVTTVVRSVEVEVPAAAVAFARDAFENGQDMNSMTKLGSFSRRNILPPHHTEGAQGHDAHRHKTLFQRQQEHARSGMALAPELLSVSSNEEEDEDDLQPSTFSLDTKVSDEEGIAERQESSTAQLTLSPSFSLYSPGSTAAQEERRASMMVQRQKQREYFDRLAKIHKRPMLSRSPSVAVPAVEDTPTKSQSKKKAAQGSNGEGGPSTHQQEQQEWDPRTKRPPMGSPIPGGVAAPSPSLARYGAPGSTSQLSRISPQPTKSMATSSSSPIKRLKQGTRDPRLQHLHKRRQTTTNKPTRTQSNIPVVAGSVAGSRSRPTSTCSTTSNGSSVPVNPRRHSAAQRFYGDQQSLHHAKQVARNGEPPSLTSGPAQMHEGPAEKNRRASGVDQPCDTEPSRDTHDGDQDTHSPFGTQFGGGSDMSSPVELLPTDDGDDDTTKVTTSDEVESAPHPRLEDRHASGDEPYAMYSRCDAAHVPAVLTSIADAGSSTSSRPTSALSSFAPPEFYAAQQIVEPKALSQRKKRPGSAMSSGTRPNSALSAKSSRPLSALSHTSKKEKGPKPVNFNTASVLYDHAPNSGSGPLVATDTSTSLHRLPTGRSPGKHRLHIRQSAAFVNQQQHHNTEEGRQQAVVHAVNNRDMLPPKMVPVVDPEAQVFMAKHQSHGVRFVSKYGASGGPMDMLSLPRTQAMDIALGVVEDVDRNRKKFLNAKVES